MAEPVVIVVAGGGLPAPGRRGLLPIGAPVVAADSGLDAAVALGLVAGVVVGDMDSVSPGALAAAEAGGARVVRHPAAKDATDLALALDEAQALLGGAGRVVVVGGDGGRLDHLLAGVLALADPAWADLEITAILGNAVVHVVHGPGRRRLLGEAGELVTLVPAGGPALGVRTTGLRYPLDGERLAPGSTRGVSNVIDEPPAAVALDEGVLLAVLPGEHAPDPETEPPGGTP